MSRRLVCLLALGLSVAVLLPRHVRAAEDAATAATNATPVIYRVGEEPQPPPSPIRREGSSIHFGNVRFDVPTKTIAVTGWVNQVGGPIEVLACGTQGKTHEAIFVTPLNPLDLQAACLLAGLKGGTPMTGPGEGPPSGSPALIRVEWTGTDGSPCSASAESMVWDLQTQAPVPEGPWTFTGSLLEDGRFKAFAEESFIVTYWDPYALLNLTPPCGADDERLIINTNTVPPYTAPVTLLITPAD